MHKHTYIHIQRKVCVFVYGGGMIINTIKSNNVPEQWAGMWENGRFWEISQRARLPVAISGFASAFSCQLCELGRSLSLPEGAQTGQTAFSHSVVPGGGAGGWAYYWLGFSNSYFTGIISKILREHQVGALRLDLDFHCLQRKCFH